MKDIIGDTECGVVPGLIVKLKRKIMLIIVDISIHKRCSPIQTEKIQTTYRPNAKLHKKWCKLKSLKKTTTMEIRFLKII